MKTRVWFISDTHGRHHELTVPKDVDIVVHAGDESNSRDPYMNEPEVHGFLNWYKMLPIKYKVWTPGNHSTSIEHGLVKRSNVPENITYLNHESTEVMGLKIFGSPFTPAFGQGWAYNVKRSKLDEYWKEIPEGTDIVITHGPPLGILDHTECGAPSKPTGNENTITCSCGDKSLRNHIERVKPLVHCFGHIHPEDRCPNAGMTQLTGLRTKFINAAVVNLDYKWHNNGVIIEL